MAMMAYIQTWDRHAARYTHVWDFKKGISVTRIRGEGGSGLLLEDSSNHETELMMVMMKVASRLEIFLRK
eukprot:c13045_g1_i1 orf=77-286(-)